MIGEATMKKPLLLGAVLALAGGLLTAPARAQPLEKVAFGTNWVAQGEHGGFYQAAADGTYRKYGLDVSIVQGGPNVNNRLLLPVGRIDVFMSANTLQSFDAVENNIPTIAVAAMFQKDPQVLMAHPGQGIETFEHLKKLTSLYISKHGTASYYQWLKPVSRLDGGRWRPHTSNPLPFRAAKRAGRRGSVPWDPLAIEKMGGFKSKVFLPAD